MAVCLLFVFVPLSVYPLTPPLLSAIHTISPTLFCLSTPCLLCPARCQRSSQLINNSQQHENLSATDCSPYTHTLHLSDTQQPANMGLLKHFRSRSRLRESASPQSARQIPHMPVRGGRDFTQRLNEDILERIFKYVCPHVQDQTYETSERSEIGDGCMLCDLRDMGKTAQVCRRWYRVAQQLM